MARSWCCSLRLLLKFCVCVWGVANATSQGKALSIPPSQFWDGNDGPWSTFRIAVGGGTKQQIRVLPASDQSSTWLVLPEICSAKSAEDCEKAHGGLYMRNTSKTWKEYGQYELSTYLESQVGYDGDGLYGFDALSLGWKGDGLPNLDNQSIAGIISPNFTLGSLALNPRPINFTDYNEPIPSLMQNLRNMDTPIPSLSWSYTAGAYNLAPKVFGSLILGGYDATRFEPNDVTFPFGADISLDFQVAIQRITMNSSGESLMSTPIISYISTLVPDIWLPSEACEAFLDVFNLTYNNSTDTFYINSNQHQQNLADNPVVNFMLGPEISGASITIKMPYWNFYLVATEADTTMIVEEQEFRFPIRRAGKDRQYILGRAFLQSAYLIADYERNSFKLSQAVYPSSSTKENIVPILPPAEAGQPGGIDQNPKTKAALTTGAIAGIAAGGAVAISITVVVLCFAYRWKKKTGDERGYELEDTDVQHNMRHEMPDEEKRHEVGAPLRHEMAGDANHKIELYACDEQEKPVEVADTQLEIYELPAHDKKYVEMEGEGHAKEMG